MILDGKSIKSKILDELRDEVGKMNEKPSLTVIQVGDNEASNVYIKQKVKMAQYIGYEYNHIKLEDNTTMEYLLNLIDELNNNDKVNGILVQMPLPKHLNEEEIANRISPLKDVDGLTDINTGRTSHDKNALYSCTPYGVMEILKRYNIDVTGMHAVVIGRSILVGKPMGMMLLNAGATVTMCHSKTKDLAKYTKDADILVVAIGKPKFITKDMVKKSSIIIDVGINRLESGLCGDVDYDNINEMVSYITPVPGGVGPMTVAMLAKNVLNAYNMQRR